MVEVEWLPPTPPDKGGPTEAWCQAYLKSFTGILKIVQMVCSIVALVCAATAAHGHAGLGWVCFVAFITFLSAAISFAVRIVNCFTKEMAIVAMIIDLIAYIVGTVLYLTAAIVAAVFAHGRPAAAVSAFFCFVCLFAWGADIVLQAIDLSRRAQAAAAAEND